MRRRDSVVVSGSCYRSYGGTVPEYVAVACVRCKHSIQGLVLGPESGLIGALKINGDILISVTLNRVVPHRAKNKLRASARGLDTNEYLQRRHIRK